MSKIILNDEDYQVKESDLPCLIIYKNQSGGSFFTLALVNQLFSSGSRILFFTALPLAKDSFLKQIIPNQAKIAFVNTINDLENNMDSELIY